MNMTNLIITLLLSAVSHYTIQRIFIRFKMMILIIVLIAQWPPEQVELAYLFQYFLSIYYYFQRIEIFDYSLFIPISIMFVIGIYDDFYKADFKLKFLLQIIVAKILIDQGFVISNYYGFLGFMK